MKKTLLALLLVGCGTLFAETHFSVGIGIGGYGRVPPPPPVYDQPPCPGDGYAWVDGYWYPQGPRFYWRSGYWRQPAYFGYSEGRGYGGGYGWREGGRYDRDRYDRGRRGWDGDDRRHYRGNEFRHDDRHDNRRDNRHDRHDEGRDRR